MSHPSTRTFVLVFLGLMGLLGATIGVAFLPLGPFNFAVTIVIAAIKTLLVVIFFMHLKWSPMVTRIVSGAGVLWLLILLVGTVTDVLTRAPSPPF